jgi:MEMO1 family protein
VSVRPRLRPIDFQSVTYQGEQMFLLRDPLVLTDYQLILPAALVPMLVYCDGRRDLSAIHAAYCEHVGIMVDYAIVADAVAQLDRACLLENERSQTAVAAQLAAYHSQQHRPPALAGLSYPAEPAELQQLLASYHLSTHAGDGQRWHGRGLVSPHIDYRRGGAVYHQVWQQAATAVEAADLVLIFGTDHNGGPGTVTLTRQSYATPWGVIPADRELVETLATAVGPELFADELHHRQEHSIELSAVWLHYFRGRNPCPMVPILCGSFHHYFNNGLCPPDDERINIFIETLRRATAGRNVLAVASVDLAHVGPQFHDPFIMDEVRRQALRASDGRLIEAILDGDAARFYNEIAAVEDHNHICGLSSIYLMLRYLEPTQGIQVAYEQCPADPSNHSLVSICGLLLA